jgi:hypothetical protein
MTHGGDDLMLCLAMKAYFDSLLEAHRQLYKQHQLRQQISQLRQSSGDVESLGRDALALLNRRESGELLRVSTVSDHGCEEGRELLSGASPTKSPSSQRLYDKEKASMSLIWPSYRLPHTRCNT